MKFPPIIGLAVYAGYRPTSQEIQTASAVDVPVKVRINQVSKWKYQAFFADSKPRQPLKSASGRPIRGDIHEVMTELANRFERLIEPFRWYTFRGEQAPFEPTPRPALKRAAKKKLPGRAEAVSAAA
jgi:hypothetical protein